MISKPLQMLDTYPYTLMRLRVSLVIWDAVVYAFVRKPAVVCPSSSKDLLHTYQKQEKAPNG